MSRQALISLVLLGMVSAAMAAPAPRRDAEGLGPTPPSQARNAVARTQNSEFVINDQTEVRLDGRVCKYSEVPNHVDIVFIEVASNQSKTILKIHFRTKK